MRGHSDDEVDTMIGGRKMTRRGISLIEVLVVLAMVGALVTVLSGLYAALFPRSLLVREAAGVSAEEGITAVEPPPEPEPPPTVEDMEEAAEEAAEEHDIYDRVVALTEAWPSQESHNGRTLEIQIPLQIGVFGSSEPADAMLRSDDEMDAVQVQIRGKVVYEQVGGEIETYLSMGEWEHLLGDIERKIAADREEMFRKETEKRFGPLPGWGDDG